MSELSKRKLMGKIFLKRIGVLFVGLVLLIFSANAAWQRYDPSVPRDQAQVTVRKVIQETFAPGVRILETVPGPPVPERIPFLVTHHPKHRKTSHPARSSADEQDASMSYLLELKEGRVRLYTHQFNGRTAAFTIVYPEALLQEAERLEGALGGKFPGFPVVLEPSGAEDLAIRVP